MEDYNYSHLHITFYAEAVKNERKSAEVGRPQFDDVEFVRIKFVGDKHNELVAPAHSFGSMRNRETNERLTYAQQFWKHYEAYQRDAKMQGSGTPLEEIGISQARIKELNASNVYSVEGLAGLDGTLLQKLGMGAREMKVKAEEYLAKASDRSGLNELMDENAELKARLERLEQMLSAKEPDAPAPEYDETQSPFASWNDEDIRTWMKEAGAADPHHKTGRKKLIQLADEWNAKLERDKAA
jgi:hypothetical protein